MRAEGVGKSTPMTNRTTIMPMVALIESERLPMKSLTLVLLLLSSVSLTACSPKAVYIHGGEKASATVDISAVGGKIELRGPFVYCSDSTAKGTGETLLNCPIVTPKE